MIRAGGAEGSEGGGITDLKSDRVAGAAADGGSVSVIPLRGERVMEY